MVYFFASQPIAEDRCAGYVVIGRNYDPDQPPEVLQEFERTIFEQDRRVVESQRPERVPFDLAAEMHLKFDAVAINYRQAMREQGLARRLTTTRSDAMKAVQYAEFGGPEVLRFVDVPEPAGRAVAGPDRGPRRRRQPDRLEAAQRRDGRRPAARDRGGGGGRRRSSSATGSAASPSATGCSARRRTPRPSALLSQFAAIPRVA